jgi:hypothetical protein
MSTQHASRTVAVRLIILVVAGAFVLSACRSLPPGFLAPDADPTASPEPIDKTMCESGAELTSDIAFLRSLELSDDGLVAVLVAVDSALGEARVLADLAVEEFGPMAIDLVLALEGLRDTIDGLSQQETVGSGIAEIGVSIAEIGTAMDQLTLELRDPCPDKES